jgi:hypothetical protein
VTGVTRLGRLELPAREARGLTDEELVRRLVASGHSRLAAERIVEIERGPAEPTRARRHTARR